MGERVEKEARRKIATQNWLHPISQNNSLFLSPQKACNSKNLSQLLVVFLEARKLTGLWGGNVHQENTL